MLNQMRNVVDNMTSRSLLVLCFLTFEYIYIYICIYHTMDSVLGIIKLTDIFDIRWGHIRIEMQISKVKVGTSFENSDDIKR